MPKRKPNPKGQFRGKANRLPHQGTQRLLEELRAPEERPQPYDQAGNFLQKRVDDDTQPALDELAASAAWRYLAVRPEIAREPGGRNPSQIASFLVRQELLGADPTLEEIAEVDLGLKLVKELITEANSGRLG